MYLFKVGQMNPALNVETFLLSTKDLGVTVNAEIKSHESQHSCLLKKRKNSNEFFHFATAW